jgi:aspartyl-tRNA(Asn)/glutamyl-tRNA(Gln) amidotransferase subunit C
MPTPKDQLQKAAELARMDLGQAEADSMAPEFAAILSAFHVLSELDVEGVEPTLGATLLEDVKRQDIPRVSTASELLLAGAPESRADCFVVPKVIGGEQ